MTREITDEEYEEYQRLKAREPKLQDAIDKGALHNPHLNQFRLPQQQESPFRTAMRKLVAERLAYIEKHREALLEAWIAQYGFSPAETALIIETGPDGVECAYVRRTGDVAELEAFREREGHVHDLITYATSALAKLDSLNRYVREDLLTGLRGSLDAVRGFKVKP